MNVSEACKVFIECKEAEAKLKPRLEAAARVLKQHCREKGVNQLARGRISYSVTSRMVLDSEAVKEELGDRLEKFQKRQTVESLSLLK